MTGLQYYNYRWYDVWYYDGVIMELQGFVLIINCYRLLWWQMYFVFNYLCILYIIVVVWQNLDNMLMKQNISQ